MKLLGITEMEHVLRSEGVELPSDFAKKAQCNLNIGCQNLYDRDVKEILKVGTFWRPAIADESEYGKFISYLVMRMLRIHCCAVNNNSICKYGIQNIIQTTPTCILFEKNIGIVTTLLHRGGLASIPGRFSGD